MDRLLKILFFGLLVKPIVFVILGLNLRDRKNLPKIGPAVIVANHNSHLDTLVLMSLYPLSMIHKIRPVAAADYFLERGGLRAWVSKKCIGIIPMDRSGSTEKQHLFKACTQALERGEILILFPEGSRGEPETMSELKKGVYYLIKESPKTCVTPVMLHGLGRALPKGTALLVPFNCDVIIGRAIPDKNGPEEFVREVESNFQRLSQHCLTREHG